MATVDLELIADFSKASKSLNQFSKEASSSLSGIKSAFGAIAAVAGTALAAFSVKKITDAASEQEQAIKSMNTALALTGEYSDQASKQMIEFADNLQKNSMYSDDAALSFVGLTKQMGASNEQTKKIIQTAADLSAVTGDSLESSVEKLSKTLSGNAGRLAQTESGLKDLTEAQLKAGAAIDILSQKYQGSAKEMTNTFGGAVQQTENAFDDLLKATGSLITQNPAVIKIIKLSGQALSELGDFVKANKKSIIDFSIDGIGTLTKVFAFFVDGIGDTIAVLKNFDAAIDLVILSMGEFALSGIDSVSSVIKAFKSLIPGVDSSVSGLESLRSDVDEFTKAARESFLESSDNLLKTKDSFSDAAIKIDNFADSLLAMKGASDDSNASLKKLSDTNSGLKANIPFGDRKFLDGLVDGKMVLDQIYATISAIGQGAQGARKLVSGAGGALVAAYAGPQAGQAAGSILDLATQGKEAVKAQVKAFMEELPKIIEALVDASPAFIEAVIENLPNLISALIRMLPQVITQFQIGMYQAVVRAVPQAIKDGWGELWPAIMKGFQDIIKGFVGAFKGIFDELTSLPQKIFSSISGSVGPFITGLFTRIGEFFSQIGEFLKSFLLDFPKKILEALVTAIGEAFKSIGNIGGKIGGGGVGGDILRGAVAWSTGGLSEIGGAFGLGLVGSSSEKQMATKIVLQVGERELAQVILNLNRQGYRTA